MKLKTNALGYASIGIGATAVSERTGAAIGGPIGTIVVVGIWFGASVFLGMLTDGIKFNKGDWNHDGKQDSIKDRVKSGIGAALDKIF